VDKISQNLPTAHCEVLTDSGQIIKVALYIVTQNQEPVKLEVLTDSGQILENRCGHSNTEPIDGTVCATDTHWTDCRRKQGV
jgi:hypothetical protein